MPRKAKEKNINEDMLTETIESVKPSKVKVTKKSNDKKDSDVSVKTESIKLSKEEKATTKRTTAKVNSSNESNDKKENKTVKKSNSKVASKKTAIKKETTKKTTAKTKTTKSVLKKENPVSDTKSSSKSKATTKKVTKGEKTTKTKKSTSSKPKVKEPIDNTPISMEYYDLPYKYNKTVVKLLAQNPNTLFAYWEVSDDDIENFKEKYGENFLYITKPILVVHNLTDNNYFEIDVNDFANNWYIPVNNTKCQYVVELIRRPTEYTEQINEDNLYITSSNVIESPNDHVLFFKENDKVYFKNIHTNKYTKRVINPFLKNICGIYKNLSITQDVNSFDFNNPSSQNPTSHF